MTRPMTMEEIVMLADAAEKATKSRRWLTYAERSR